MILHWMQSLLHFLMWYAIASVGGCLSYWLLRLAPQSVGNATGQASIFVLALCGLARPEAVFIVLLTAIIPSCVAAFCEKAVDAPDSLWSSHFGLSIMIYLLSFALGFVMLGTVVVLSIILGSYPHINAWENDANIWGVGFGFLLTPASISLFRWIIHTYQFRPGLDRHLKEGE